MALWIQRRNRTKKPAANAFCFSTKSLTRCWPELGDQADDSPALKTESSALNEGHGRQWNSSFWGLAVVRSVNHLRVTPIIVKGWPSMRISVTLSRAKMTINL